MSDLPRIKFKSDKLENIIMVWAQFTKNFHLNFYFHTR
jgi:hypothetical protein